MFVSSYILPILFNPLSGLRKEVQVMPKLSIDINISASDFARGYINEISDNDVRTFFDKLNIVTRNIVETPESRTDSIVHDLLHLVKLNSWSLIGDKERVAIVVRIDFGETQITAEILAYGDENKCEAGKFKVNDQNLMWVINRWPEENYMKNGLDLVEPDGR
ncbi:3168_t:CDS:2 [Diversispora eburnea]|uniref:3168_t:CDS:1 n=1 Tax=Diversispora eburnea TaxID=1213867 RepID=A0A9N9FTF9_9GLOM|nr:3168_t:CDS:2 [Diversispora eburnea]